MIHYHGLPLGCLPQDKIARFLQGRHAFISFADIQHLSIASEVCQSFAIDNGAFSFWKRGENKKDWSDYYAFLKKWYRHPSFDWAIIPDSIQGDMQENDDLLEQWPFPKHIGVPVWHLHEKLYRLSRLCDEYRMVALGSSGEYAFPGDAKWYNRMNQAMEIICDNDGNPRCKIHSLRGLNPSIFVDFPFSSADSTNVAQNIGNTKRWNGTYTPVSSAVKALVLADRIESFNSCSRWIRKPIQPDLFSEISV